MQKHITYEGHVVTIDVAFDTGKRYSTIDGTVRANAAPMHRVVGIVDDVEVTVQFDVSSALLIPVIANVEWECKWYIKHGVDCSALEDQLSQIGFTHKKPFHLR